MSKESRYNCIHNNRCRTTLGYLCEDCMTFVKKNSIEYIRTELLNDINTELHNLNASNIIKYGHSIPRVDSLLKEVRANKNELDILLVHKCISILREYNIEIGDSVVTLYE